MPPEEKLPDIQIIRTKIDPEDLRRLVERYFGDMVKVVVDLRRKIAAVGGELHADAEALLLEDGSLQEDLWGANYYPGLGPARALEFTALINIRPAQDNPGMEIADPDLREELRRIVQTLVGSGELL